MLAHELEVGLGDHAAIGDDDHRLKAEAGLELCDLRGQRLVVVQLAREDLDRNRPAGPVAEQPVDDLPRSAFAVTRIPQPRQRASAALEVGRGDVVEHQLTVAQVAAREAVLDPLLALQQPIKRRVKIVLIGAGDTEFGTERGLTERPDGLKL